MTDRPDDDAFVRDVAAHYAAPPMTASQRTRFDARLEERVNRGATRSRSWIAAGAVAAAVAAVFLWQAGGVAPTKDGVGVARVDEDDATLESAATPEEWILATGSDSLGDADDGLPADYVAISDLLLADK
jgi:hypothetical protein